MRSTRRSSSAANPFGGAALRSAALVATVTPAVDLQTGWWRKRGRIALSWGALYLVFLAYPVADLVRVDRPGWLRAIGWVCLLGFVALYLLLMSIRQLTRPPSLRWPSYLHIGTLVGLALILPLVFDDSFCGLMLYAAIALVVTVPPRVGWWSIPVLAAANIGVMLVDHSSASTLLVLGTLTVLCPVGMIGMAQVFVLVRDLATTREENARLAVTEERLRFARDLHDLLGHSLSLIVLKSELAGRLAGMDSARAAAEITDIEAVARQALVEVRQVVGDYRRSLTDELTGARSALGAAAIEVSCPQVGAALPTPVESLMGWAVREATTNVLRHSHASQVRIRLESTERVVTLTFDDDGVGPRGEPYADARSDEPAARRGHGLCGLAERTAAIGGTVLVAGSPLGGFRLRVCVPADAAAPRCASGERAPDAAMPA